MRTFFRQKWVWKGRCACCQTSTRSHLCSCTHSIVITKTFDRFDPQPAAWWHACAIKELLEREQIACALKVKVMRALFSRFRRYLIHYTLFVSTAGTTRIINIVLAVGLTSPSPRQVHNILGREGRDLLWLFSNPLLFFPPCSLRSVAGKTLYNMQHVHHS